MSLIIFSASYSFGGENSSVLRFQLRLDKFAAAISLGKHV